MTEAWWSAKWYRRWQRASIQTRGTMTERVRQDDWEAKGAVVFPISPSYPGVDLIVFTADMLIVSEVKGQEATLYGQTKADALNKVRAAAHRLLDVGWPAHHELVHVHPDTGEQEVLS